ncbi:ferrochelatase [Ignatzschineria cameli]|uniref:Ferrochelatase n=1 Tax=Ignatzschineria cameli TaxID=2182793 RepID=A0A2U2AJF9_9GAMM|nr:ferrochelatase [Ignatzschineria cameli]PWD82779.1 ferrochelatase [Ignatzschineria cameli]PWD83784.1 ferrochelatase [Ignatzschineria cameli]PWD89347.1 ferrochelatase [Ignatzschineria cameli]PWD90819.1 ferrochelatase [Ignatzschineria cameli]PWD91607.1 ferrochelatase [Ignatzschineria cameli]
MKKIGVVLTNLGTPDAPTKEALKVYLEEFLKDPRVIEEPKWKWYPILYGIILNTRPQKSAEKYQEVWDNGSPLLNITKAQAEKLTQLLPENYQVEIAMRYGNPSIESAIKKLIADKVDEIVIFPLYPQYSAATTASVMDKVGEVLRELRYFPALRVLGAYYQNPYYIDACVERIRESTKGLELDKYVFSYHGMPRQTYLDGDPYYDQCLETTRLIAERMGEPLERFETVFQSRFGRAEWLQPYAAQFFEEAPGNAITKIAVFCPGFSADCLETLEEMAMENYELFMESGGEAYTFIPCINSDDLHIEMMKDEVLK